MAFTTPGQLRWRLINESDPNQDEVTFVLPFIAPGEGTEYLLETGVKTQHGERTQNELKWSEKDLHLFICLFGRQLDDEFEQESFELNFTDPSIIEMINIVASARFSIEVDLSKKILAPSINTKHKNYKLGEVVAINTQEGFKLAVAVDFTEDDIRCVVLEPFVKPDSKDFRKSVV